MARILFLQKDSYECFGVMYLSAAIKLYGHTSDILIQQEEGSHFLSKIVSCKPDIIAFSVMTGFQEWVAQTALIIKKRFGYHIIAGGPHCTFHPEFIQADGIDAICRGEGEETLPMYMSAYESGRGINNIPGWWIKSVRIIIKNELFPLNSNMDDLEYPDRQIYRQRYPYIISKTNVSILVARGCPYTCTFCYNSYFKKLFSPLGSYVRRHSISRVIDEIVTVRKEAGKGLKWISFTDDLFIMDRNWMTLFLDRYKWEVNLPFGCSLRANLVDEDLIRQLAEAGCKIASFGIETGNDKLRNEVLNKNISKEQIIKTGQLLCKYNIKYSTFNMFNIPDETVEKAMETIALNLKIRNKNYPWSGLLQPYYGTDIFKYANKKGLIPEGGTGANFFHKGTIQQPDTEKLMLINSSFYWIIRFPILRPIFEFLIKHRIKIFSKPSLLLISFHRNISLFYTLEGKSIIYDTIKSGLKRIKSYI
ncbi:MAG: radical SAM protein [Pseudomonadota bacterium]